MSAHTRKPPASRRCGATPRTPACVCLIALLVAGCAHGVRLSDADRAQLISAPRIHVLPYETPLPHLKLAGDRAPPTPTEIRRHAAADPATLVARSFAFLLGKKERLKNLQLETHRPPPRVKSAADYGKDHWRGLALDLWVEDWTFEEIAGEPGRFNMRFTTRARLARIDDGRVLWSTGRCSLGGNGQELHLSKAELTRGTRLRKLLTYTREECARQLIRDFSVAEVR